MTTQTHDPHDVENELDTKAIVVRDGAALRTSKELGECFLEDACNLLDRNFGTYSSSEDEDESLETDIAEYEGFLASAGYTVIWNDGYVIYKDLSDKALDYLADA